MNFHNNKHQISFSEVFDELKPDIIIILGDRFEMFAVAAAAMIAVRICGESERVVYTPLFHSNLSRGGEREGGEKGRAEREGAGVFL